MPPDTRRGGSGGVRFFSVSLQNGWRGQKDDWHGFSWTCQASPAKNRLVWRQTKLIKYPTITRN